MSLILVKIWLTQKALGKNFGDVFFDVFRQAKQFSEEILPKYCLGAEILDLSTLFVRDCSISQDGSLGSGLDDLNAGLEIINISQDRGDDADIDGSDEIQMVYR